jgi:O-antigen/teichoic acid export membrane protein
MQGVLLTRLAKGSNEFSGFTALRDGLGLITIPFLGVQTAFAQLTVRTEGTGDAGGVSAGLRAFVRLVLGVWVVVALGCLGFHERILADYKLGAAALAFGLAAAIPSVVTPALFGVMQGREDFLWLGGATIVNGAAICSGVMLGVLLYQPTATGAVAGMCVGWWISLAFAAFRTRAQWRTPPGAFDFAAFFRRFVPLSLGLAMPTFMFGWDILTVQRFLSEEADGYGAARVVGRTVVLITAPLTYVLFPKVVRSVARSEETGVLTHALAATALVGGLAALGCAFVPWLPLRIISGTKYLDYAPLVPWFAWALLPLAMSGVLINNLLARECYGIVGWIVAIAGGYALALRLHHPSAGWVIFTMGTACTLLVLVCWAYTRWAVSAQRSRASR